MHGTAGTERVAEERCRASILAEAARVLAAPAHEKGVVDALLALLVPGLADWCAVDLVDEDGGPPRRVGQCGTGTPASPGAAGAVASDVLRTGEPRVWPRVAPALLAAPAFTEPDLRTLRGLPCGSLVVLPLVARRRAVGVVTCASSPAAARYAPEDVHLLEGMLALAAAGFEHARLSQTLLAALQARDRTIAELRAAVDRLS